MENVKLTQVGQNMTLVVETEKVTKRMPNKDDREALKAKFDAFRKSKNKKVKAKLLNETQSEFGKVVKAKKAKVKVAKKIEKQIDKQAKTDPMLAKLRKISDDIKKINSRIDDLENKSEVYQSPSITGRSSRGEY